MVLPVRADDLPAKSRGSGAVTGGSASRGVASESAKPAQQHIEQLIRDLGNSHYSARRAAASELRQIGPQAFDLLHAATDDVDPEVAASANYLLRQIPVRWVQPDDSAAVRVAMRQYAQESEPARLQRVEQLDNLANGAGTGALCRIARYDRSPLVSRTAALAMIRPAGKSAEGPRLDPNVVEQELGASTRAAAQWLRQYLSQLRDPAASVAVWKQLIEQESARLDKNTGDSSSEIVLGLYWNLAEVYRQLGDRPALNGVLDRMVELAADGSDKTIVSLLAWLTENKSWDALDAFLAKHQSRLEQSKRPLYYAALARVEEGKQALAEELAVKAAALHPQATLEGVATAKELELHGQFEWAVREYRRALDKQPVGSLENIFARIYLPSLLHDYEREKEAADTLEPLVKAVHGEGRIGQLYNNIRESTANRDGDDDDSSLPSPEKIAARYHFYRACQYQNEKDWQRARGELELAIKFDPTDADVLIAMYRLPEADAQWREATRERIRKLAEQFQHEIDEKPSDPSSYNQWAWLISNTEGDFQKAIRYSQRSLELDTHGDSGAASFLDTLGRCYYAAGDYTNAVKYERQAIEKIKYMQVMQRQLALFEKALAEQQGAGKKTPSAKSN